MAFVLILPCHSNFCIAGGRSAVGHVEVVEAHALRRCPFPDENNAMF